VISKTEEHEINRAGKRLLREVLEQLGWVVNDVQEDYGIDSNVQVFEGKSPTGVWFHVQLKSSASSNYAADRSFVSQELFIRHAQHYARDMREPVLLIHADVVVKSAYWYAPQLDHRLTGVLGQTGSQYITVRIPTRQQLPETAPELLENLNRIYLLLASRELTSASNRNFAESIKDLPDQAALHRAFQEKNDTLKLQKIVDLVRQMRLDEAKPRAELVLADPDSAIETKFWARIQLEGIEFSQTFRADKPQSELPKLALAHAKELQKLTHSGPKYLKFYSLIVRQAAELEILTHENSSLFMALHQHLRRYGNPMVALAIYERRSALTKRIVSKYNQCVRLARYAIKFPDRWMLGRALVKIVHGIGRYLITLHSEKNFEAENAFAQAGLQICKIAAWICEETGDAEGFVLAILGALMTAQSTDSDAYRWAKQAGERISDPAIRSDALLRIERAVKRWKGDDVEGDHYGDVAWQILQNMATALGVDVSDENTPLVRGLRIAAKDNSPERVLARCEHILVTEGAIGPIARQIRRLFNTTRAASKVVNCTLHNFHVEGKDLDTTYAEFKRVHCDTCPDQKPRPEGWRYTDEERAALEARHSEFVERLAGTSYALRYTDKD
jgi:hypothetical protein